MNIIFRIKAHIISFILTMITLYTAQILKISSFYLRDFVTVSRRLGLRIDDIESNPAYAGSGLSVYTITFTICSAELKKYKTHHQIIEALRSLDYIYHIEEIR